MTVIIFILKFLCRHLSQNTGNKTIKKYLNLNELCVYLLISLQVKNILTLEKPRAKSFFMMITREVRDTYIYIREEFKSYPNIFSKIKTSRLLDGMQ